ncbi:MAG: polymer-forming cytoskeletal protein [Patescibacteria group bacterium]|jgi:cytoskeletal protein CcmA (bactofilin family)
MFSKDAKTSNEMETVIGPSVQVEGNFSGQGNVIVEGGVTGTLKTAADIKIGEGAKIKADVEAQNILCSGEVRGNTLTVKDRLDLTKSARVYANVKAKVITMEAGAVLTGKVTMTGSEATEPIVNADTNDKFKKLGR